jgi:pilus assembly protein CpaB
MDRRTRAFIVVGLAAVLATGAAYGVYRAIQTRPVVQVPIAERFTVVASRAVPIGTQLTADMIRVVGWPADSPVTGGHEKPEEVVGRGVTVPLVENEPIIDTKLAPKGTGGGLGPVITPGMRAVAVRVNDVISVAGYVLPGTHVDVIVTMRPAQESISRIVLSNVKVLSTGPMINTSQDGKAAQNPPLVTLELTPADAERLSLASNQGQIALALRNPLDVDKVETSGARMGALLGSPAPEPIKTVVRGQTRVVAPPPPPPPPKPASVEVIAGNQRREQIIKK